MNYLNSTLTTRKTRFLSTLVAISFLCGLTSCDQDEAPVTQPKRLQESVEIGSYTASQLKQLVAFSGIDVSPTLIKYDVKVYKVTYLTPYKGSEITASGIVVLPQGSDAVSMVSIHHGTIIAHDDAPSEQPLLSEEMVEYAAFASLGFIAVIPDYIGFGAASFFLHPYYVEDLSASSVIDNLKAAAELAESKSVTFDKDLFLVGYSEGGYVTMATHKYLDQNPVPDFNLVASFPAAGGYDIKRMQEHLFGLDEYPNPFYIAYVAYAYKTTFDWKEPLTDWFNEPYASKIPGLFTGQLTGSEINASLTDSIPQLISNDLLTTVDSNPKYAYIVNAFAENSLTDWVPMTPMYMYHGDADTTIPYENSQAVYEQLLDNGASDEVAHLITLEGAEHGSGLVPYIEDVIPRIMSLDGD